MKTSATRRIVIAASLVAIIAAAAVFTLLRDPYKCLTTRQWLSMLPTGDWRSHHAAIALRRVPKDRLFPVIREWISATNIPAGRQYDLLSKLNIVPVLSQERKRTAAYQAIALIGPEAKPFVSDLKATVLGPGSESTFDAAFALLTIGSEGHSILASITEAHSEKAQFTKIATADMLTQPTVNAAMQNWSGQTAEDVNRLRCIFNLKCLTAKLRAYAASVPREGSPTNAPALGRRPRSMRPL